MPYCRPSLAADHTVEDAPAPDLPFSLVNTGMHHSSPTHMMEVNDGDFWPEVNRIGHVVRVYVC